MTLECPTPGVGDYVVMYRPRVTAAPRVVLVRVQSHEGPHLIRATFAMPEDAGPRFERDAVSLAAAAGNRAWRCDEDGRYSLIAPAPDDEG